MTTAVIVGVTSARNAPVLPVVRGVRSAPRRGGAADRWEESAHRRRAARTRAAAGKGFGRPKQKAEPAKEEGSVPSQSSRTDSSVPTTTAAAPEVEEPKVPEEIADAMMRRMILFSALPFFAGVGLVVPGFYYLRVIKHVDVPPWIVYATSTTFLGISLLGITYGVLSTSGRAGATGLGLGTDDFMKNVRDIIDRGGKS